MKNYELPGRPVRVSITGIDGAGKDTIAKRSMQRTAQDGLQVAKLGRPAYILDSEGHRQIFQRTTETFDAMHHRADLKRDTRMISAANALNVVAQSRVLEPAVCRQYPAIDVIASSRDPRVDPTVYFDYYASMGLRNAVDMRRRLVTMQRLTRVSRDLIVLLEVDPEVAVERIEARMAEEEATRLSRGGSQATMRDKWRHMHENATDLGRLATGYETALELIQDISPVRVLKLDTTEMDVESVVQATYDEIKSLVTDTMVVHDSGSDPSTALPIPAVS